MPTIDSVFELSEIRAAHTRLASNATFGKVVVRIDSTARSAALDRASRPLYLTEG